MGIGFAIPVDSARLVMDALLRDGQVTRGWIGVEPRDLTADIAESFNLKSPQGVLITGVLQGGPASAAGMRPGDVVTRIADKPVANAAQLLNVVAALKPNSTARLLVQRGGSEVGLDVTVAQRPKTPLPRN
jgi:S1-C subfamily serine protease